MHVAREALDEVEQRLLGPVKVLDDEDRGTFRDEPLEQIDPRLVQLLACDERMDVARRLESERQPENLARSEAGSNLVGRIAVEDPELLLQDLAERPVRHAAAVRQAAAAAHDRLRRFRAQALGELARDGRLANAGVADDRDEVRLVLPHGVAVCRGKQVELAFAPDEDLAEAADTPRPRVREGAPQ